MSIVLGCIADDFTGATDLANTLVKEGMRTVQLLGLPPADFDVGDAEAVVVALKSRTIPAADACTQSLQALEWLGARGAKQIFFKYCSTFDSTDEGNIGPVADALLDALGSNFTIACPAFPTTGRTIYKGYLFVGDQLLSESPMKDHPLTPMRDASLVRVLGRQSQHPVGMVEHAVVGQGAEAISQAFEGLKTSGHKHAIVDAINDADLRVIGEACAGLPLITGGSGVALGLPENYRRAGWLAAQSTAELPAAQGRAAVMAGSCSVATRGQLENVRGQWPMFEIDPFAIAKGEDVAGEALAWVAEQSQDRPVVIFSSADPEAVAKVQDQLGRNEAGELVEGVMAAVAEGLVAGGVGQLVVAGGETSGAVVSALGVQALRIGPEIDPGVPWCETLGPKRLALALKSGNFGAEDFFAKSLAMLES